MRTPHIVMGVFALILAAPLTAAAQQTDGSAPAPAASAAADDPTAARDRLHLLLLRPDVRRVARDHGIDLRPLHDGVETLGPQALARIAPYADDVEAIENVRAITISTTTIIIGLLLIILLVLIA